MAEQKHMMEIQSMFDHLFGEDIDSLKNADQILLEQEQKKNKLKSSVSII